MGSGSVGSDAPVPPLASSGGAIAAGALVSLPQAQATPAQASPIQVLRARVAGVGPSVWIVECVKMVSFFGVGERAA